MRVAGAISLVVALAAGTAIAQPRRPAPAPAPAPPAPLSTSTAKPTPVYESCYGAALVYITSRTWRECCLLCGAGNDSPSDDEIAEAEAALEEAKGCGKPATVVNQYFTVTGGGRYEGKPEDAAGKGDDKADAKPKSMFARNRAGGLAGLESKRPSFAVLEK